MAANLPMDEEEAKGGFTPNAEEPLKMDESMANQDAPKEEGTPEELPLAKPMDEKSENEMIEPKIENQFLNVPNEGIEKEERLDTLFDEEDHDKSTLAEINFDMADTGRWLLKVISGPNNGAEFSMNAGSSYVIGTDPNSCDIIFHDTSVSRQQARIIIGQDDSITIEDLKSRNGTLIEGEKIKTKTKMEPNAVVTIGTTSFTIYDREGEMQTIISPLLPAIVKTLQQEEPKKAPAPVAAVEEAPPKPVEPVKPIEEPSKHEKAASSMAAFIVLGIITGLFVIIGLGTATLFKSEPVKVQEEIDTNAAINQALAPYPSVKSFYNKNSRVLQLTGHVLTLSDKNQILYSLQGINSFRDIDSSGIIIDEFVWQEINQAIAKNPNWKGISIFANTPGKFVISGYLQTRKQASDLREYLTANFSYYDRLENRVFVEEELINLVTNKLQKAGFKDVSAQVSNNEITLTGSVGKNKKDQFDEVLTDIQQIEGVRDVKNFVTVQAANEGIINISDRYNVTGFSRQGKTFSVVIQGMILTKGDELDGMLIKEIRPNSILLEKNNVQYRIDFGR
jgi:type III secretion system YscD/HrpQ family protein